ncbi:hypothetical protein OAH93_02780 [Flavobacteriales bacterium]|nr:hypothetical protein [Flavobacteriales bacterium]
MKRAALHLYVNSICCAKIKTSDDDGLCSCRRIGDGVTGGNWRRGSRGRSGSGCGGGCGSDSDGGGDTVDGDSSRKDGERDSD